MESYFYPLSFTSFGFKNLEKLRRKGAQTLGLRTRKILLIL